MVKLMKDEPGWYFLFDGVTREYVGSVQRVASRRYVVRRAKSGVAGAYWPVVGTVTRPADARRLLASSAGENGVRNA